jgi:hypothetical protein
MSKDKLTKKLQVLLSEEEVFTLNRIILNDAIEREERPISISAFIRELIRLEIDSRSDESKIWDKNKINKLKSKK